MQYAERLVATEKEITLKCAENVGCGAREMNNTSVCSEVVKDKAANVILESAENEKVRASKRASEKKVAILK